VEWYPISSRVIAARFKSQGPDLVVIQVYAPTSDHGDEEVEDFYANVQSALEKTSKGDLSVVLGDFNAKVGQERTNWPSILGPHGYGNTNERGERLLQFCTINKLCITNTWFQHKDSQKWTWIAPQKKRSVAPGSRKTKVVSPNNMIDYILIDNRWKSSILDARSFPSASIGSDHNLVLANLRIRFNTKKVLNPKVRIDVDKLLTNKVTTEAYKVALANRFESLKDLPENIDEALSLVNENIREVAKNVIGVKRRRIQPWINDEVLAIVDKRR
jgi:exonuclease III